MQQVPAFFGLAVTLGLVLARPRLGAVGRIGPGIAALAGVLVMLVTGVVRPDDLVATLQLTWRPLIAISAIMVMTHAAQRVGVMEYFAARIGHASGDAGRLFALVYALSAITAAALNNDSAILLLTPLVVALVRRKFPDRPDLAVAFAFAVFMAAGVAPFVVSNPMNMIVASYMGVGFNDYAARMVPIAIAGWVFGFGALWLVFRRALQTTTSVNVAPHATGSVSLTRAQYAIVGLVLAVLCAYPVVAYLNGTVWLVAVAGAVAALGIASRSGAGKGGARAIVGAAISWDILAFLFAVSVLGAGLRNAGAVAHLAALYQSGDAVRIGVVSALGSALINNHPMSIINMLALHDVPSEGHRAALAALIGGDLGPRLFPMGSLAGLLWLASLRRLGVEIAPARFAAVGAVVLVPTLAVSLWLLYATT